MKRRLSFVIILLLAIVNIAPTSTYAEDISNHWAYGAMSYLIQQDIMKGDDFGNYRPNDPVSRAEFATFLVRTLKLPSVATPSNYHDVKQGDWYYDAINQASYYQIIKGDPNGYFHPKDKIDRQQMAVMIKRALDYLGIDSAPVALSFADNAQIADWAYENVQRVVSLKLLVGKSGNTFAPLAQTTRGEAAAVLYRIITSGDNLGVAGRQYVTTNYSLDFSNVLSIQANNKPKVDGAGVFVGTAPLVAYYLNSNNFTQDSPEYYQFLKLSTAIKNLDADKINQQLLATKGNLAYTANAFIDAGLTYEINAIYLMSHALHETGNGTSPLAKGIEVGLNGSGNPEMVTDLNRSSLTNIKVTYNLYGIGAIDANPNKYGSERAYKEGWFTLRDAVIGGAKFVKEKYIGQGQDTLYKMRWNPDNPPVHQYATHVAWSIIQARKIHDLYALTGANETTQLIFDVPKYLNQPSSSPLPPPENQYAILPTMKGAVGQATVDLNMRTYPVSSVSTNIITKLPLGTEVTVIGGNGGWYRVTANGQQGWVADDYVKFINLLTVMSMDTNLNVRSQPSASGALIGAAKPNSNIIGVFDANKNFVKEGNWYKVIFNGQTGWVDGTYIVPPTTN